MRLRRFILFGLPFVSIGTVLFIAWVRPGEPRFQGKPLSFWLTQIEQTDPGRGESLSDATRMAISRIGSNAVPYLVEMLKSKDSAFAERVRKFYDDQDWGEPPFRPAWRRQYAAAVAFEVLGPAGVGAIPKLQVLLDDEERVGPVASALVRIGSEAIPALTNGLASTNREVRRTIAFLLGRLESKASPAIPALKAALGDADAEVAGNAARSLGRIRDRPAEMLPVFRECLMDSKATVRKQALQGIGNFEEGASRELPRVLELMGDPDEYVRHAAMWTACKIEKEPIPLLISQLQNPKPQIRQTAAYGLGFKAHRDTNAFNALTNLLSDEVEAVRKQAARSLHSIDRPRAFSIAVP